jgi:two-component sensor histidine kinase
MRRDVPLRLRLPLLVAGTMLPLILFAAGVVYSNHVREREAAFERVLEVVRGTRLALDAEMQGITLALEVLAGSQALQRGDLAGFRLNVEAFLRQFPEGASAISLADRTGQQLFNSNIAAGEPLPPRVNREAVDHVLSTERPFYSNLFIGSVSQRRIITVSVPVVRDGAIVYELSFNPPFDTFQTIIERQRPSPDWTISIFDRNGFNFARLPSPQTTIGERASPTLYAEMFKAREAKLSTVSLEGVPLMTAYSHSPLSGWIVAAGIRAATINAPLWRNLAVTTGIGTVLLVVGSGFAVGMARRIARGEALHTLLVNELNHRVKNTLATVQSIAAQTFREAADPAEARRKFDARLAALGRAHNVLSNEKWEAAELREIVEQVLEPYAAADRKRLHLSGPEIRVAPRTAVMISMALHELATNAAKYGALSNGTGEILIDWAPEADGGVDALRLTWREKDGPPVRPVERKGFGSRLIEDGFARQPGSSATLEYHPTGLSCTLHCPRA